MSFRNGFRTGFLLVTVSSVLACAGPTFDKSTPTGKQAILDAVNLALNIENCSSAVSLIDPLYNSPYTDNTVRLSRASAYGCEASINALDLLTDLQNANLVANMFWRAMSEIFWSTDVDVLDKRITAAAFASDATMSALKSGTIVAMTQRFNSTTLNMGSTLASDRIDDANLYQLFVSMAAIGALENRFSAPNPATFLKTRPLGWTTATPTGWERAANTPGNGCEFAASVLNLTDTIGAVAAQAPPSVQGSLVALQASMGTWLSAACDAGCTANAAAVVIGQAIDFSGTACAGIAAGVCTGTAAQPCPATLRNWNSCTGAVSDRNSCAAAGIARFVDQHVVLGWN